MFIAKCPNGHVGLFTQEELARVWVWHCPTCGETTSVSTCTLEYDVDKNGRAVLTVPKE